MPDVEKEQGQTATICFEATLLQIGSWTLLRLPASASVKLPSRGMTMVQGTINRNLCTEPTVSQNGVLREPTQAAGHMG
jgi:hypothetical protein